MKRIILILVLFLPLISYSQNKKEFIKKGNDLFKEKKYTDSEIQYLKSLELDNQYYKGHFNLGDALYKQEKYEEAAKKFESIANQDIDKDIKAKAYHNLGNSYLKAGKIPESIEAFKNSLRNNPKDVETKYNLEYAKRMLVQQQQQQQQNQQNKDQNQDKQQQQQQQQQQDNKDKKQDNKQQQQQQQQQQEQKISKENAERMLQTLTNDEKKIQKDLKKKAKTGKSRTEKEW